MYKMHDYNIKIYYKGQEHVANFSVSGIREYYSYIVRVEGLVGFPFKIFKELGADGEAVWKPYIYQEGQPNTRDVDQELVEILGREIDKYGEKNPGIYFIE